MNFLIYLLLTPPVLLLMYPVAAWLRYIFSRKKIKKSLLFQQPITIIIAVFNEEKVIRRKIESFLEVSEWIPGSEIIVTSTGSDDGTNETLREFENHPLVKVIISPVRISKIMAVNHAVSLSENELLLFSDCRQPMKTGSVRALIANFNDPEVGTVVAALHDPDENQEQSFFRKSINKIVWLDSQSGSGLNLHGALYAQRKSLFKPFPENLLFDDLFVIVSTLSQQKRLVQEREAVIYDVHFKKYYQQERLQRLARGLLIFLVNQQGLLRQLKPAELYRFLVFKYVKLLLPFSIIGLLAGIPYVLINSGQQKTLAAVCTVLAVLFILPFARKRIFFLFRMNYHFFSALLKFFLFKEQSNKWEKLKL